MRCEQYESCLHLAAVEGWNSFHCQDCSNNGRYPIDFFPEEFEGLDDWGVNEESGGEFVEIEFSLVQPNIDVCLIYESQEIEVCSGL